MTGMRVDGVLFDKDGTLFDFNATWAVWAGQAMRHLAEGRDDLLHAMAAATRYDLETERFFPDSPVIAGTARETAECFAAGLPHRDVTEIERYLNQSASEAPLAPAVPLGPFCDDLLARGLRIGVMTNDSEFGARRHLQAAGVLDRFHYVCGFDSGHGGKPSPQPLLAFASQESLDPARVVMVGDSTHDLIAGRAAGMQTVAVLTGVAGPDELEPHADVILPDIGHLPDWIG